MAANELPLRNRAEMAKYVLGQLSEHDVNVPADSWLLRLCNIAQTRSLSWGEPDFPLGLESDRDLQYFALVFDSLVDAWSSTRFHKLVSTAVKNDPPLPQDNRVNSTGRDALFHLLIAAVCKRAGFDPVEIEPNCNAAIPDIICGLKSGLTTCRYVVEAKRSKSLKSLGDRLRDGADQIARSGLPGVIVADLTIAINPENLPAIEPDSDRGFAAQAHRALVDATKTYTSEMRLMGSNSGVLAVILLTSHLRHFPDRVWGIAGNQTPFPTTWDPISIQEWDLFEDRFFDGFPNQHVQLPRAEARRSRG